MEKRVSDGFHYYHFLQSAANTQRKPERTAAEMPEAPGLPVIVHAAPESKPRNPKNLRRRWRNWRARPART